jgi:hypothetical protein
MGWNRMRSIIGNARTGDARSLRLESAGRNALQSLSVPDGIADYAVASDQGSQLWIFCVVSDLPK